MISSSTPGARGTTLVVAVAESLPDVVSAVALETDAVFEIVVPAVPLKSTLTTSVKVDDAPFASELLEQLIEPVLPTNGVVQPHRAGTEMDWKVVPAGMLSTSCKQDAAAGPKFVTVIV